MFVDRSRSSLDDSLTICRVMIRRNIYPEAHLVEVLIVFRD